MAREKSRSKELKKRKHQRIFKRTMVIIIVTAALVAAGLWFYQTINRGYFDVKHIEVAGNEAVDSKSVRELLPQVEGQCIFILNMNQLYADIQTSIDAKTIHITKKMPDTLVVTLEESPVLCAIVTDNQVYYLNQKLKITEVSQYLSKTNVPILSGLNKMGEKNVGDTAALQPEWKFSMATNILEQLKNDGYLAKISELNCTEQNSFKIITKNNLNIEVKDLDNFHNQYSYIQLVLDQNQSDMDINLTTDKNPIVKSRT
ncbi:MAG: FtsQ-type POTRA domain-containing protein [Eubacteriaceae bacterium]|nr:FtsQ-type POTRA domain-containing protein [Eubacteriaceae bacterium]MDD4508346.1 FtsQ-type POTRA domain-containing protein [Eubacteriaceae bacterium]